MEQIFYWIGLVVFWLSVIAGFCALLYLFLAYMVTRMGDNVKLFNYLTYRKDFNHWYYKIRRK